MLRAPQLLCDILTDIKLVCWAPCQHLTCCGYAFLRLGWPPLLPLSSLLFYPLQRSSTHLSPFQVHSALTLQEGFHSWFLTGRRDLLPGRLHMVNQFILCPKGFSEFGLFSLLNGCVFWVGTKSCDLHHLNSTQLKLGLNAGRFLTLPPSLTPVRSLLGAALVGRRVECRSDKV